MIDQLRKLRASLTDVNPSIQREYYVSPDGNDKRDGRSLASSLKTPERAIEIINNLPSVITSVALYIAPGAYFVKTPLLSTKDFFLLSGIVGSPGMVNFIGSGDTGSLSPATDNMLKIEGRRNTVRGITFFVNSPNYTPLSFADRAGGGGYGGLNLTENCYFYFLVATSQMKYGIVMIGSKRNTVRNCVFSASNTAGIYIVKNVEDPTDIVIENNQFIGTGRGVLINGLNYNTIIKNNLFSSGSKAGEVMVNGIEITALMTAGKVIVVNNQFEQSQINSILDNKVGGTLIDFGNEYGA